MKILSVLYCFVFYTNIVYAQSTSIISGFSELRRNVLNYISSAKARVWLATDYLTDGEIVAALYVAQYRKLNVKVLLNKKRANSYMSRLRYLKRQKISVFIKPRNFPSKYPTLLIIDNSSYEISGNLNFLDKRKQFKIINNGANKIYTFSKAFNEAILKGPVPRPRAVPLVGRAKHKPNGMPISATRKYRIYSPSKKSNNDMKKASDVYNYDLSSRQVRPPKGMPKVLPKKPIYERNKMLEIINN